MAVIAASEEFESRRGGITPEARTATRSWQVETSDRTDSSEVVLNYVQGTGLTVGTPHPHNSAMTCREITAEPKAGSTFWRVTASYSSAGSEIATNPLSDAAKITWQSEQFQVPMYRDLDGKGVLNSAGDQFDPPLMRDFTRRVAIVTKNVATVPTWVLSYEDAVNSDTFVIDGLTVQPDKAKCQRVSISDVKERSGIQYREVNLEIHFSRGDWIERILDAGFRTKSEIALDDVYQRLNIINDGDDEPPPVPVLLDGDGNKLDDPSPDNAVFLEFRVYPRLPFSALPLT